MKKRAGIPIGIALLAMAMAAPATAQAGTTDLAIAKTDNPDPVSEGAALTYTIDVTNQGPDTAAGVKVTDKLDSQVSFVSVSSSQGSCKRSGANISCDVGTIGAAGGPYTEFTQSVKITITVRPKKAGQLSNTAQVAAGTGDTDPNTANNTATQTTTVTATGGGGGGGHAVCAGKTATIVGTRGADALRGTAGRDVIKARGGNDVISGLQRRDIVCAGGGNDVVKGKGGGDTLKGGSGRDLLRGGGGNDDLLGGPGRDHCRGGGGRDLKRSC